MFNTFARERVNGGIKIVFCKGHEIACLIFLFYVVLSLYINHG